MKLLANPVTETKELLHDKVAQTISRLLKEEGCPSLDIMFSIL